jgi:hypothetical protein
MTNSRRLFTAAVLIVVLMARIDAYAALHSPEPPDVTPPATITGFVKAQYRPRPWVSTEILPSIASLSRTARALPQQSAPVSQPPSATKQRSVKRKIFGAIFGATGGFFAGGYLGAAIEGDCNCDDPGLKGAVIGAPIGAAAGGILGYKFLF